jgi:hypothetical protein
LQPIWKTSWQLHISGKKCNSYRKKIEVVHIWRKSATIWETSWQLHISGGKVQLVLEINRSCTFTREKYNPYGKLVGSCTFLEKSATCIRNKSKMHISREKCNPYGKLVDSLVGSCTFLEISATRIKNRESQFS